MSRIAIVVFPGSNCELDAAYALDMLGAEPELVWHRETDLSGAAAVVLPGGFAHGDYLRTGAIARFSPVMAEVERLAAEGRPVLGVCNGFQILCEAGLLPGAMVANRDLSFICRHVELEVTSTESVLTANATVGDVLHLPLNSYEGNYVAEPTVLSGLGERVVLRYRGDDPNGSTARIAGICNEQGNVAGLMPHPERAVEEVLGSTDGRVLIESFIAAASLVPA
jgi:phosphoribosylformylglycinamidine synthase subunit PurQ / glutaminase